MGSITTEEQAEICRRMTDKKVICSILLIYFYICFKAGKRLNGYKATPFCLVYLGRFSP